MQRIRLCPSPVLTTTALNHPATNRTPAHILPPAGRSGQMRPCGCCTAYSQTRLRHRLEREYIPACLRDALERDPTYKAALLFDPIEIQRIMTSRRKRIQSQSIQPAYLSTTAPTRSKPTPVFRETDFCLSYSHLHPLYASLYKTLCHAPISHTTDTYTEAAALFTGIEVKSPLGNLQEAQLQMSIWMAASLRKKAELAWSAIVTD
ncbi:hypothetical protein KJE20_13917 [Pyrenophora tritici-repentis]|uniref:PD-(D/E)XK nuclease-like domain-containing protein n=1 Tax=Pyrenophora tritici-repentis TaxID=45151 RepID=A0A922SRE0_9PLEO|nr:hypothetical protein Ptr86124_013696 [Pyrenophora tritici-repentis]KAI1676491.1 hypothetical protein KJE20_13917 [Pyrenophora tritici-repentis]